MCRFLTAVITFVLASMCAAASASAAWIWPVRGDVITQYRNGSDPYATGQHRGIDIAAPVGTAVVAAAGGDVRFAGTAGSSGLTVSVRTGDGYDTSYLHLSSVAVRAGAHVSAGQRIGAVGTTGSRSTAAPHLHFGVRDAGTRHAYHDPLAFLPPPPTARVPDPPAPAPAPAPVPAPPATAPAPVRKPTPTGAPVRRRVPAPTRVPAPRAAPAPRRVHAPTRSPAPHAAPAPGRVHAPTRSPAPHAAPAPRRVHAPTRFRASESAPGGDRAPDLRTAPASASAPAMASDRRPRGRHQVLERGHPPSAFDRRSPSFTAPADRAPGPDRAGRGSGIGWLVACGGLLLAAAVLGVTGDRQRAARRTRSRLRAALPALGRR